MSSENNPLTRELIMGVPWVQERVKSVAEIRRQVPEAEPVWDEKRDAMDTWRKVLRTAGDDPVVILEDDITLTANWRTRVEAAIKEHPDSIIQFFSMRKADLTKGSRWEPGRTFMMNQCYYLPATYARQLLDYSQGWEQANPEYRTGYDITMARWMQENKLRYWVNVPSLVQHRAWKSEIQPKRPRNRQSSTFETPES